MDKKIYGVIYGLIDGTNDFEYIGQTVRSVEVRFKEHAIIDSYVGNAIRAHGEDMFVIVILKVCYSRKELDYWERHLIKSRNTLFPNGYNQTVSGGVFGESKLDETPYKNLLAEMKEFQFSYTELAKILGVMSHTVSRKMNGTRKFTEKDIGKLVEFFGLPAEYLMKRIDGEESISRFKKSHYKNLSKEADKRQLSYKELAKLMGLSFMSFSNRMRGKRNFTAEDITKLVEIFGLSADYLMSRDDGLPATISKMELSAKSSASKRFDNPFKNLTAELNAHNLSYSELAKLMGLSFVTVSDKMRGKNKFTARDIAKLVEIFGKPVDYLLERDDGKNAMSKHYKTSFKNLLVEMDKRKLSYSALAKLLGLKMATVSAKMHGLRKFTAKDIAKLVEIFGKPADYLMKCDDAGSLISKKHETPYKNLLAEMNKRQLTYRALAKILGLSQPTVSEKMSGRQNFTAAQVTKLVEIFGLPADYLLPI